MFWTYYLVCLVYCLVMLFKRWNRDVMAGGLGISPGLDTLGIIILAPFLAPVDITITWIHIYKKAEEARRKHADTDNSLDGIK